MDYIKEFGVRLYILSGLTRFFRKLRLKALLKMCERYKYKYIINWLDVRYGNRLEEIMKSGINNSHSRISKDCIIWFFWWQGEENMPSVVKSCYNSIIRNREKHSVILLTKKNIREYISIDEMYYDKLDKGAFTLTHFSDIVRENLLFQKGGIWMDATIWMTGLFDNEVYQYEYYTIKGAFELWQWTGFFQGSCKGNIFPQMVSILFDMYWKDHNQIITYLLIDCCMAVVSNHSKCIQSYLNGIREKDSSIFEMNNVYLDRRYDEEDYMALKKRTNIHKLSYKEAHKETIEGYPTLWKLIIDNTVPNEV